MVYYTLTPRSGTLTKPHMLRFCMVHSSQSPVRRHRGVSVHTCSRASGGFGVIPLTPRSPNKTACAAVLYGSSASKPCAPAQGVCRAHAQAGGGWDTPHAAQSQQTHGGFWRYVQSPDAPRNKGGFGPLSRTSPGGERAVRFSVQLSRAGRCLLFFGLQARL